MSNDMLLSIDCPLLKKIIHIGLCEDISSVAIRVLAKTSVPEVDHIDIIDIKKACMNCLHNQ